MSHKCDKHNYVGALPCPWPECFGDNEFVAYRVAGFGRVEIAGEDEPFRDMDFGETTIWRRTQRPDGRWQWGDAKQ